MAGEIENFKTETIVLRRKVRTALSRSNLPGLDFSLNPYIGCIHGCIYCYAKCYVSKDLAESWGKFVIVKEDLLKLLKRVKRVEGKVGIGTVTDAYQKVEEKEMITREALKILLEKGFKVSIQTKSDLVVRDLDVFKRFKYLDVGFTITTLDENKTKILEPNAPLPEKRIKALKKLASVGIKTWIFLGPIIPGTSFEEVEEIVEIAARTRSSFYYDKFRIKDFMRDGYLKDLAERAKKIDWKEVFLKIREICEKHNVKTF